MRYLNLKELNREIETGNIEACAGAAIEAFTEDQKLKFSFENEGDIIVVDYDGRKIEKAEIYNVSFDEFTGYGQIFEEYFPRIVKIVNDLAKDNKKEVVKSMFWNSTEENEVLVINFDGGNIKVKEDKTYLFFGNNGEITVEEFAKANEKRKEVEEILRNIVEIAE